MDREDLPNFNLRILDDDYISRERVKILNFIDFTISNGVAENSLARKIFKTKYLSECEQSSYKVEDGSAPIYMLPSPAHLPMCFVENIGEEVYVPSFEIETSFDWLFKYSRCSGGRNDIFVRSLRNATRALVDSEDECAFKLLTSAVTHNYKSKEAGVRPASIVEVGEGPASGFFSKELINLMIIKMARNGQKLTDLFVSPEDLADTREWLDSEVEEAEDVENVEEAFECKRTSLLGRDKICGLGITLHSVFHLGGAGKFNINSSDSASGMFRVGSDGRFNDYTPTNVNEVDENGQILTPGDIQIYGLDLSHKEEEDDECMEKLVMPIRQDYEMHYDNLQAKSRRQGFYGYADLGMAILNPNPIVMGVIDKSEYAF